MSSRTERTHVAILDAAWKLLSKGSPARLEDVAREAGVSRQALYLHFRSRSGLLVGLVQHMDEKLGLPQLLAEIDLAATPEEALIVSLSVTGRYAPRIHAVAMALVRLAETDPDARAALTDRMDQRRDGIRALVRAIAKRGALRPEWTVDRATDALWAAGAPHSLNLLLVDRGWPEDQLVRWLTHLGRSMLAEKPSPPPRRATRAPS